jgi:hypothetical protein
VSEIFVDTRRTVNIKLAIADAIENGEYESLANDIRDCFTDDQVEEIERLIESGDLEEAIDDILAEWNGDTVDELLETMNRFFFDSGIELLFDETDLGLDDDEDDKSFGDLGGIPDDEEHDEEAGEENDADDEDVISY